MSYDQVRKDFEFLETIAPLDDQVELDSEREALMRDPTKAHAAKLYRAAIVLWFGEHGDSYEAAGDVADRYGVRR